MNLGPGDAFCTRCMHIYVPGQIPCICNPSGYTVTGDTMFKPADTQPVPQRCPKCFGPMKELQLFTSTTHICPRCESTQKSGAKPAPAKSDPNQGVKDYGLKQPLDLQSVDDWFKQIEQELEKGLKLVTYTSAKASLYLAKQHLLTAKMYTQRK